MTDNRQKIKVNEYTVTEAGFPENQRYLLRYKKAIDYIEANAPQGDNEETQVEFGNLLTFASLSAVSPVPSYDDFLQMPVKLVDALISASWELNPEWRDVVTDTPEEEKKSEEK